MIEMCLRLLYVVFLSPHMIHSLAVHQNRLIWYAHFHFNIDDGVDFKIEYGFYFEIYR